MKKIITLSFLLILGTMNSQQKQLPFYEIGEYPSEYSSTNIVSRMIEGLGYRFYWATESLLEKDLNYKPSDDSRSTFEVIKHIYDLSSAMVLTMEGKEVTYDQEKLSYEALREKTLNNLQAVYKSLKDIKDFSSLTIILNRKGKKITFPFWNMINGPISDAIWHCGQVVANRRASGNPINSKVNVFVGKTMQ
tara:strand:+ start:51 stop:626 length:576 start_codon:yes stop_codon:yes gene_type:complete